MTLWISFALLAAVVATLLIRNGRTGVPGTHSPDLDVYRDQLDELQSDAERGVIDPGQAAAARAEIARRLLKQAAFEAPASRAGVAKHTPVADKLLFVSAAAVPILGLFLYLAVGTPGLPGSPLAERLASAPNPAAPNDMIAKVEARLREKPDDGQGWAVIAPVYLSMGRAPDAANAFARAISLLGETPERLLGLAKSNVMANNGMVNEPARAALQRLAELEPDRIEAKYWLGVYDEQNGRPDAAAATYLALLSKGPADAPWRKAVEERLAAVTGKPGASPSSGMTPPVLAPAASGPDGKGPTPAEFVAAAQKLAPEMREQMIGRMVTKATDAVKANPQDVAAWSRIVTGHTALGKLPDAKMALKDARQTLSGNAAALTELDALAKSLNLNS